jgi:uncharacterized repeat protein (TIGR03803 family)
MLRLVHYVVALELTVSAAGCGGNPTAGVLPDRLAQRRGIAPPSGNGYVSLYSFKGAPDGASPLFGSLIELNGELYGTTVNGGVKCSSPSTLGCGTVFGVTPTGDESVVYAFKGDGSNCDGEAPWGGLVAKGGTLYGTTSWGGCTYGTVFSLTPSGNEDVLFRFDSYAEGVTPLGTLIPSKSNLYGATQSGGAQSCQNETCGIVFDVTTSGNERPVYEFKHPRNGEFPNGIIAVRGTFYGTALAGGRNGLGDIFAVDTSGKERALYSFKGGPDGSYPQANLIAAKGVLYGTTTGGGEACVPGSLGCGTVFSFDLKGKERVLYRFKGGNDGFDPAGVLADVNGVLYGTTVSGGGTGCSCGTVFEITTSGKEKILYRFFGSPDGASPEAGLTLFNGKLYGTTSAGGDAGAGTVYEINP